MRILILITKGEVGGAQQSVFNLARGLKARGAHVVVGFDGGDFLKDKLTAAEVPFTVFRWLRRSVNPLRNLLFMIEVRNFVAKNRFDVVHCNSSNTLFGAIGAKFTTPAPKVVFTFRGLSLLDNRYMSAPVRLFYHIIFWFLLRFINAQVFVSQANQEQARNFGIAYNDTVIHNGIDFSENRFLPPERARQEISKIIKTELQNDLVLGSIGRLAYQKNYEFLLQAAETLTKKNQHIKIVIIGEGPEAPTLKKSARERGITNIVFFAGSIPDAARYLKAFDIFVLPSRYEGMPITLIETLGAGVPAVATDVGGNAEVLGGVGIVYPLNDATSFIEHVTRLANDQAEREKLQRKALALAPTFSVDRTVELYYKLFSSLTAVN